MTTYTDNANGGVDIDLPDGPKTDWLLEEGYIGLKKPTKSQEDRGRTATSVPAKDDPTLAINRETPVGISEMEPHVANEGVDQNEGAETVLGKDRGLKAKVSDTAPTVKVTSHAKAGLDPAADTDEGSSLKSAIDKEQGQPPLPGKGVKVVETEDTSLKDAINKEQPPVTAGPPV